MPKPPDPADFPGAPDAYAFKSGLYRFLRGVHRRRLAGRLSVDPGAFSRWVTTGQRIPEADLARLIEQVRVSERTPPTPQETALLRRLHMRAEREADREGFERRSLRAARDQALVRTAELEALLDSARQELARLRARTGQVLREDAEQAAEEADRLAALEARVRELEAVVAEALAGLEALEERLTVLEQRLPDGDDPATVPNLADDPVRAARVLAGIPDPAERTATAGDLVAELAGPGGILLFFTEFCHAAGAEALRPVVDVSVGVLPVRVLASLLVAAAAAEAAPEEAPEDGPAPDGGSADDWPAAAVAGLLHTRVHERLAPRPFAALVHLLAAEGHRLLADALLEGAGRLPVPDVVERSGALLALAGPCLEAAALARPYEDVAALAAALRTAGRDADARTVLHAAGRGLRNGQAAGLVELLKRAGRLHDLREVEEGAADREL